VNSALRRIETQLAARARRGPQQIQ
jgi:hypothetical protein